MSDKVYGFCGRNKCKREVFAKGNAGDIQTITCKINETLTLQLIKSQLTYPDGFNKNNCIPICLRYAKTNDLNNYTWCTSGYNDISVSVAQLTEGFNITLYDNAVAYTGAARATKIFAVKVTFLKVA